MTTNLTPGTSGYRSEYKFAHVIGHHSYNRRQNLRQIVERSLDWKDANITVVWNNSDHLITPQQLPGALVVDCPFEANPIHGRYLAALIWPHYDYWLFQDDDLILTEETANKLVGAAINGVQRGFYGIEGRKLDMDNTSPYTNAHGTRHPQPTDMVVRVYACHRTALLRGLQYILGTGISSGRSETWLFTAGRSHLVPDTDWLNLPEGPEALCANPDHHGEIDRFVNRNRYMAE